MTNVEFPGLPVQYKLAAQPSSPWQDGGSVTSLKHGQILSVRTGNTDKTRFSPEVHFTVVLPESNDGSNNVGSGASSSIFLRSHWLSFSIVSLVVLSIQKTFGNFIYLMWEIFWNCVENVISIVTLPDLLLIKFLHFSYNIF